MLAIMDIPSADAYQFPMAALQNHAGAFVKPTIELAEGRPLDVAHVRREDRHPVGEPDRALAKDAYPGMMPVYAAAPTLRSDEDAGRPSTRR